MTTRPLSVGLIGLGNVALAHLEGYRSLADITVVAGADPRVDRTEMMARRYRFTGYTDYREMLAREQLDLVAVLSTVATHRDAVLAAAERGLHVLCEKPLALTVADADAMIAGCRRRDVQLFYAASYRFLPPLVKARELIRGGALGTVRLMTEAMIGGSGPSGFQDMGPHHYPIGGPGGSGNGLVDHGIHLVDLFPWLVDSEIVAISGRGQRSGGEPVPEFLAMELRSGAIGHLIYDDATWSADLPSEGLFSWGPTWDEMAAGRAPESKAVWQAHPGSIKIYGTLGTLRVFHYANRLFFNSARGCEEIPVPSAPMPGQFAAEMASFLASIRAGTPPAVSGLDGKRALTAVLAAYQSMDTGTEIRLESPL